MVNRDEQNLHIYPIDNNSFITAANYSLVPKVQNILFRMGTANAFISQDSSVKKELEAYVHQSVPLKGR